MYFFLFTSTKKEVLVILVQVLEGKKLDFHHALYMYMCLYSYFICKLYRMTQFYEHDRNLSFVESIGTFM